jgi:DNA primase large subunit
MSYIDARWVAKYPFDPHSIEYLREIALDIDEYFSDDLIHVVEYSYSRALSIRSKPRLTWDSDEIEAVSYFLALLIVRGTENRYIYYMFSDAESKRAYALLLFESPENVVRLSRNLGLQAEYVDGEFTLPFFSYASFAYRFPGHHWRAYYSRVSGGRVYLDRRRIARIIAEVCRERVVEEIERVATVPPRIREYSERLLSDLGDVVRRHEESARFAEGVSSRNFGEYPPCMRWMLDNVSTGLPHFARFTLVTFLGKMGFGVDEIIEIFSRVPDFNPEKTRYQVEHILGMRGGRKVYAVPSCRTLKSYSLCFPDSLCEGIKHPLQYVARVRRRRGAAGREGGR